MLRRLNGPMVPHAGPGRGRPPGDQPRCRCRRGRRGVCRQPADAVPVDRTGPDETFAEARVADWHAGRRSTDIARDQAAGPDRLRGIALVAMVSTPREEAPGVPATPPRPLSEPSLDASPRADRVSPAPTVLDSLGLRNLHRPDPTATPRPSPRHSAAPSVIASDCRRDSRTVPPGGPAVDCCQRRRLADGIRLPELVPGGPDGCWLPGSDLQRRRLRHHALDGRRA